VPEEGSTNANGTAPEGAETSRLPVISAVAEARPIGRPAAPLVPAPLAAATGGFLVGVVTLMLTRLLRRRRGGRVLVRRRRRGDSALEIAGTRSFLVDVHLIKR